MRGQPLLARLARRRAAARLRSRGARATSSLLSSAARFHVDNVSSPHVYVRLGPGQGIDDLTPDAIRDASQWVKAQSIEGCKLATATILYTPWANLRKDGSMATGQVSFHSPAAVRRYAVLERDKETLRRLEKTREERTPDLAA